MRLIKLGMVLALAAGLVACDKLGKPASGNVDGARIAAADSPTNAEWVSYGKGYSEQRFSPLDKINASNVGQLGLAWYAQFDTDRGQEATPLVVDGVMYTTTAWSKVFAFDAATGKMKWRYGASKPLVGAVTTTAGDVVLTGELNGDLVALDGKSGKELFRGNVGGPIAGGVMTYAARSVQHVAVVSGYVGVYNTLAPEIGGNNPTINIFRLAK